MNFPSVSVVIPAYNAAKFIRQAIANVLEQTLLPLEIIVVDDGSIDDTAKIAESFAVRLVQQENMGVSAARNRGIREAKGEFIAFLDADDLWTKDKLETQVEYMQAHPEILFTVSRIKFFLESENYVPPGFRRELLEGDHIGYIMQTLMARPKIFDLVGFFDEKLKTSEDVDWFARAKDLSVASAVMPKVLLHKRIHKTNIHLQSNKNNFDLLRAVKSSINRKHSAKSEQKF